MTPRGPSGVALRRTGVALLGVVALAALLAGWIAPHRASEQIRDMGFAPPMRVRVVDEAGRWRAPFVYPLLLDDRLERRYVEDRSRRVPLDWLSEGRLVRAEGGEPLMLLGGDALGRDVFSRLLLGARWSLGVAVTAALGALVIGIVVGGVAGFRGGLADELLMRGAEFLLVLPTIYVVLALRAVMPLVLPAGATFVLLSVVLAAVGWPWVARGVRSIVASEATREYADAARSLGASPARVLVRHLLPASAGHLAVQATLLLPAFVVAEATLSYVGLGFPEPTPSWGAMLREAANVRAIADYPWLLAPAGAIVAFTLGVNLVTRAGGPRLAAPGARARPLDSASTRERRGTAPAVGSPADRRAA